uniref:Uncharacterized protein n=1 Tax=Arundo donax TaxID=35708 RepID=A0A0A8Y9X4_ARUDO
MLFVPCIACLEICIKYGVCSDELSFVCSAGGTSDCSKYSFYVISSCSMDMACAAVLKNLHFYLCLGVQGSWHFQQMP